MAAGAASAAADSPDGDEDENEEPRSETPATNAVRSPVCSGEAPLGSLRCSEGVSGEIPAGQLRPEQVSLPLTSSDEEEVGVEEGAIGASDTGSGVGALVLRQIKSMESPVHMEGFSFGDEDEDIPEETPGPCTRAMKKKAKSERQKTHVQEKLVFVPGQAALVLGSECAAGSAKPKVTGAAFLKVASAPVVGATGQGQNSRSPVAVSQPAGGLLVPADSLERLPNGKWGQRASRGPGEVRKAQDSLSPVTSDAEAVSESMLSSEAAGDAEVTKRTRKEKRGTRKKGRNPSVGRMEGDGVQRQKPVPLLKNVSVSAGVTGDPGAGPRVSSVMGDPRPFGALPGATAKTVSKPAPVAVVPEGMGQVVAQGAGGDQGPAVPPAATAGGRSYANVAAGGTGASSLPGGSADCELQRRLLESLRRGQRTMNVGGREVDLAFWVERHGLGAFRQQAGETVWSLPTAGQEVSRRNVARLRWSGNEACPSRKDVVELLLKMGFRASDIFALIHPYGTKEFDISFVTPEGLELFWSNHELVKGEPGWRGFTAQAVSRQSGVKRVTVLTRNESLSCVDIMTWLGRYGEVVDMPRKNLDEHGIWSGAWTFLVKLKRSGQTVAHIPSSAFLGRDRILVFYQGQPKVCHRCGDPTHLAAACKVVRCALCGEDGHLAAACERIRCHLCGDLGHPFSRCPRAFARLVANEARRAEEASARTGRGVGTRGSSRSRRGRAGGAERAQAAGSVRAPGPGTVASGAPGGAELEEEVRRIDQEEARSGNVSEESSWYESADADSEGDQGELGVGSAGVTPKTTRGAKSSAPRPGRTEALASLPSVVAKNRYQALASQEERDEVPVAPARAGPSSEGDGVAPKGKARARRSSGKGDGSEGSSVMDTSVSKKR
ncbi:hypothetical protein PRIEUP_LOCUS10424, partial [Pristimantis euphronides]